MSKNQTFAFVLILFFSIGFQGVNSQGIYNFWGMTPKGGTNNVGVLFRWDPHTNNFSKKYNFSASNGSTPYGSLMYVAGKMYGMTHHGGANNLGVIFEWNPTSNTYTKKIDFNGVNGANPSGDLVLQAGKFYGMTQLGGGYNVGVIFEWDPATNAYTKKIDFDYSNGSEPFGNLLFTGNKFYGMTSAGGLNYYGAIFEWDPGSNILTKKVDINWADGVQSYTGLSQYGDKFYGPIHTGGPLGNGTLFEWDPASNVFTKKVDFDYTNGADLHSDLVLYNGKFYGTTEWGGVNGAGVIFEWDPVTNILTKKVDFNITNGKLPYGTLKLYRDKFYGMTSEGGANGKGVIYEWDPATNILTKKIDFNGTNGANPLYNYRLLDVEAAIANGTPGSCVAVASVTINSSNNNKWVPIVDNTGNAVAEIKANGNNLGVVAVSFYKHNGSVREDVSQKLYLDRNITITPAVQPSSPVDIRLYIKGTEFNALKTAVNSGNQPSGVNTINDLAVFKNSNACSGTMSGTANPLVTIGSTWGESDYVLSTSITSFSTFYFAKNTGTLPVIYNSFVVKRKEKMVDLTWTTATEQNNRGFHIQRSADGINFVDIDFVAGAGNSNVVNQYKYLDAQPLKGRNYYRLQQEDLDGRQKASEIHSVLFSVTGVQSIFPNPARNLLAIQFDDSEIQRELKVIGMDGKLWISQTARFSSNADINISNLPAGIYLLRVADSYGNEENLQFVKQ